jgi:hypothetical protein
VSLIFDALKKLERDKDAREPGVLVVGSVPWGARTRSFRPLAVALATIGLVALLAFALWPRDRGARPATAPARSDSSPAPAPTPSAVALPPAAVVPPSTIAPPASAAAPPERRRLAVPPAGRDEGAVAQGAAAPEKTPAQEDAPVAAPLPPPSRAPAPDDLRLNAISQRDGRPMALINDRLVFEGDSFDGVKILRIGEAEVEVEVRGKRRVLRF